MKDSYNKASINGKFERVVYKAQIWFWVVNKEFFFFF